MVTLAPELDSTGDAIRELKSRGITVCLGHTDATYEQARTAIAHGVSMVTHLYNAMPRPHHRKPGILGLLGAPRRPAKESSRSYFGIIADGIHVHPSMVHVAYATDPERCVLVTDAIAVQGLPDGIYEQARGEVVEKRGLRVSSTETGKLAGRYGLHCSSQWCSMAKLTRPVKLRDDDRVLEQLHPVDGRFAARSSSDCHFNAGRGSGFRKVQRLSRTWSRRGSRRAPGGPKRARWHLS